MLALPLTFYAWQLVKRPSRAPVTAQPLFSGVTYTRQHIQFPQDALVHIVEVDLTTTGIAFATTPSNGHDPFDTNAQTVGGFLAQSGAQVAINGSFFHPFISNHPLDFYPHDGDPVNVQGYTIAAGDHYSNDYPHFSVLCIRGATVEIKTRPPCADGVDHALTGHLHLVQDGRFIPIPNAPRTEEDNPYPRTAVALNESRSVMWLIVVDGKQPYYSNGLRLAELAQLGIDLGASDLLALDGGGSSTLVYENTSGQPALLNAAIHTRIPMRQRPVANQLALYADPLP